MTKPIRPDLSIEEAAQAFAALGSESRIAVLRSLVRAGPEGVSMGDLAARTGISASTLSHHIRFLTQAGLAHQVRAGRSLITSAANFEMVNRLSSFLIDQCCADAPNVAQAKSTGGPNGC